MSDFTIYHNPRCSKSRATLALLEERGIAPEIILYLDSGLDRKALAGLLTKLGMSAHGLVRTGEEVYKTCGLGKESSEQDVVAAMSEYPKLIERPIVVHGNKAVLGRPPENVLGLLD
ncbi:MAG: arsenate reductase [Halioglobus sp.]|jgi:arsenate reductase